MDAASTPMAAPEEMDDAQDTQQPDAAEGKGGPLSRIEIEPAENGGAVVTHYPKVSDRVRAMGRHSPKKHVFEDKAKTAEHVKKHIHRLKA